jgi:hypothetical protein
MNYHFKGNIDITHIVEAASLKEPRIDRWFTGPIVFCLAEM